MIKKDRRSDIKIGIPFLNSDNIAKSEVSDIFNISRSTLYRWLDE